MAMKKQKYPEPVAGAFIRSSKGEFLFVKSAKWKNRVWTVPGGHVELGERITDALRREVMEEVGLRVRVTRLLTVQEVIYPREFIRRKHFLFFDFLCEASDSKVRIDRDEVQDYTWVKPRDLRRLNVDRYTAKTLSLIEVKGTHELSIPLSLEKSILLK